MNYKRSLTIVQHPTRLSEKGENMELILDWLQHSSGLFLINLLCQITALASVALIIAARLKHSSVSRYGVLYSALLSLTLVLSVSSLLQFKQATLFTFELNTPPSVSAGADRNFIFESLPFLLDINELLFEGYESSESVVTAEATPTLANTLSLSTLSFSALVLVVWVLGASFALFGILRSQIKLNRLVKGAETLTEEQTKTVDNALAGVVYAMPTLKFKNLSSITSPMLIGIRTPTIYLPPGCTDRFSSAQLQAILLHELAHLQRNDIAANYVQKVLCAIFWFHPMVRAMDKLIDRAREEICDNYALAHSDPVSYGEVLLEVGTMGVLNSGPAQPLPRLALGVHGHNWNLEDRVKGLLDNNRETDMKLSKNKTVISIAGVFSAAVFISACQVSGPSEVSATLDKAEYVPAAPVNRPQSQGEARYISVQSSSQDDGREPPLARVTPVLSEEVVVILTEIQSLMKSDSDDPEKIAVNLAQAKELLDELTSTRFASLNDFEKASSLNFLTNYYLLQEDYPNAIVTFERILEVSELRADIRLRALRSLGQLTAALEQWQNSIGFYTTWRDLSATEDQLVYKGLSQAHYQLEQFEPAIGHWESYIGLLQTQGHEISRNDYAYLNRMYFAIEDLEKSLELTKEMILNFNDPRDWNNLKSIYATMGVDVGTDQAIREVQSIVDNGVAKLLSSDVMDFFGEGDYVPLIAEIPQYPSQAAKDGIEGWVLVEFNVLKDGSVEEQSIKVVDADPAQVFDLSSLRAAEKFEFKPRVVNGESLKVEGVRYLFRFVLEQDE